MIGAVFMRGLIISGTVLLLLAALMAGPCAACFASAHACCTSCSNCQKMGKCAAPSVDLSQLQKVHSNVSFSLEETSVVLSWFTAPETPRAAHAVEAPYSPPDLYLRNSVLTV
jgi:hypothetical protein